MELDKLVIVIAVIAILSVALAFTIGIEMGKEQQGTRTIVKNATVRTQETPTQEVNNIEQIAVPLETIELLLPGINPNGEGVTTKVIVQRTNGTGRAFLNFGESQPLMSEQTQTSFQNAIKVARHFDTETTQRFAQSDLLYTFGSNTQELAGKSAGAAMAVATIALLKGDELNESVAITGSVNANGSIGKVGGVMAKALALKKKEVELFLIPQGESIQENPRVYEVETCQEQAVSGGILRTCQTERRLEITTTDVSGETGISVAEVDKVSKAYGLMVKRR